MLSLTKCIHFPCSSLARVIHPRHNFPCAISSAACSLTGAINPTREATATASAIRQISTTSVNFVKVEVTKSFAGDSNSSGEFDVGNGADTISNNDQQVADPNGLTVTSSCSNRIKYLAKKRGDSEAQNTYLRVEVDAGGCSGFQYDFTVTTDSEEEIDEEDDIIYTHDNDGIRVVTDHSSLEFLRGSKIDYVEEMIRSSFAVVDNPNSESACGCGSSFAMKNFEANKDSKEQK